MKFGMYLWFDFFVVPPDRIYVHLDALFILGIAEASTSADYRRAIVKDQGWTYNSSVPLLRRFSTVKLGG